MWTLLPRCGWTAARWAFHWRCLRQHRQHTTTFSLPHCPARRTSAARHHPAAALPPLYLPACASSLLIYPPNRLSTLCLCMPRKPVLPPSRASRHTCHPAWLFFAPCRLPAPYLRSPRWLDARFPTLLPLPATCTPPHHTLQLPARSCLGIFVCCRTPDPHCLPVLPPLPPHTAFVTCSTHVGLHCPYSTRTVAALPHPTCSSAVAYTRLRILHAGFPHGRIRIAQFTHTFTLAPHTCTLFTPFTTLTFIYTPDVVPTATRHSANSLRAGWMLPAGPYNPDRQ